MNFVLSAIAPETIVAAVAQNTVWKIRKAKNGTPSGAAEAYVESAIPL